MMIDPDSRDIVENMYIRRVERVNGRLENVIIDTYRGGETDVHPVTTAGMTAGAGQAEFSNQHRQAGRERDQSHDQRTRK